MSAPRPNLWPCLHTALGYGLLILTVLPDLITASTTGQNCSHPIIPEHTGFYCKPSPCRGFPHRSVIHYFCDSGYVLQGNVRQSKCHGRQWKPNVPVCIPIPAGHPQYDDRAVNSIPSVATTAVGVSIFLLTTTACMVVKSRLYPCQSRRRRSSDQLDLMVDGLHVTLPTYEEAMYGSWGQRLAPLSGPTQLLLASSEHRPLSSLVQPDGSNQNADAPPPYEVMQQRSSEGVNEGEARAPHIALSVEKDS